MTLYEKAVSLALRAHAGQVRKTDHTPYILHPLAVAHLLTVHQAGEEVAAAAVLHDVLEDTNVTKTEIEEQFGAEVLRIIEAVTENKSLPWEQRKEAYVKQVVLGGEAVFMVSVADKIHNALSLIDYISEVGDEAWSVFNRGKESKLWFENLLCSELKQVWSHPLLKKYEELIEVLRHS